MPRIASVRARSFAARVFTALGVPPDDARLAARLLVRSDMRGVRTHGLKFLPVYARRLEGGGVRTKPRIKTVKRAAWGAVLDGDAGLGQIGASAALRIAMQAADRSGVGLGVCRNTSHVGALAAYMLDALPGRVVLAMTNTGPSVAPPGGNFRAIGNNCIGFAAPIRAASPLCLDMTTSVESWGKVRDRIERNELLPPGIALAPDGSWATDPAVALAHTVAAPLGGGKGFGLAMMIDILAAGLSAGSLSPQLRMLHREIEKPEGVCCAFMVMALAHFPGGRTLPTRLAQWRTAIKSGPRTCGRTSGGTSGGGVRTIHLPGERAAAEEAHCRTHGLPLASSLRRELDQLAAHLHVRSLR